MPLVGIIGRLTDQKGFDLTSSVIQQWAPEFDVQWAILGTGEPRYHQLLESLAQRFPGKVAVRLEFSDALAHRIEAGSDIFLMPSQFEPCGLNQMFSLKYGAVPVVRAVGGLADTITDASPKNLAIGAANGFSFNKYSIGTLAATLRRACDMFRNKELWRQLTLNGMSQDWSWGRSAKQYVELYAATRRRLKQELMT